MLADFVWERLDDSQRSLARQHLSECQDCSSEVRALTELREIMDAQNVSQPPSHYFLNLLPRIRSRIGTRAEPRLFRSILSSRWVLPLAAMALMVSLFVSTSTLMNVSQTGDHLISKIPNGWGEDELLELTDRQIEKFPLSPMLDLQDNLAYAISTDYIADQLAGAVFAGNVFVETVPFSSGLAREVLREMNDEEVEKLIQRLSERTLL